MKTSIIIFLLVFLTGAIPVNAQLIKIPKIGSKKNSTSNTTTIKSGLTEQDAVSGIKEALVKGTGNSVQLTSAVNGYFGNPEIKIPFPEEAKEVEAKLREIGMGKKVDEFILSMNRAAEDAAKSAEPIFVNAIKAMTVTDALNIVKGNNDTATRYLDNKTSPQLNTEFQPVIKTSLDKVDATKYWTEIITIYNKIPMVKKMNPNLTEYVTGKAITGLFVMIAKEEAKIRKDPVARTTDILKKVFGS